MGKGFNFFFLATSNRESFDKVSTICEKNIDVYSGFNRNNVMELLYQDRIYRITYTDQIDLVHGNLVLDDMCPKRDEYFVDRGTKAISRLFIIIGFVFSYATSLWSTGHIRIFNYSWNQIIEHITKDNP